MARQIKYKDRSTDERAGLSSRVRQRRAFYDPFPWVHGTLPEKMVYKALSERGIPFLFLNDIRFAIPEIGFDKEYQADFVIPSLKIIIEVQGAFWHSKPKTVESDAYKFAVYEMLGWKVLAWWDFDIIANLPLLFANEPALQAASRPNSGSSELPVQSRKKQDTSKGIRTLNRRRGQRLAYKKKPIRIKKRASAMRSYRA